MRRITISLFVCLLALGATETQAQAPKAGNKTNKTKAVKDKFVKGNPANGVKKAAEQPAVKLPEQSNDCLFAIQLEPDVPYGPTTAPQGGGRLQEIQRDKNNRNLFEYEHNTVWYKFEAPYNGELNIAITQVNP
ncbi:MAG: hypothetical protein SPJ13_02115, partial [Bacteroidales bacterium]|nr:hypothetical protein [Bacteroidales bacterium]